MAPGMTFTTRGGGNGELFGLHANPHKGQNMAQGSDSSRPRSIYAQTVPAWPLDSPTLPGPCTRAGGVHDRGNGLRSVVRNRTGCSRKPAPVKEWEYKAKEAKIYRSDSGDVIRRRKIVAIGKSSALTPLTMQTASPLSYDGDHPRAGNTVGSKRGMNSVPQALRRVRNQGYVAPPKQGALANPFKSGGGCC